jgi:hypothetical protein
MAPGRLAAMTHSRIGADAFDAFQDDLRDPPPVSLRGGNEIDSYGSPTPFDPELDAPTEAYLERHAFWALPHLDARSWRHYLPRLIDYALRHPDDSAMVTEGLVRSLRPPDRFPPRLGSLDGSQEAVVRAFLEVIALESNAGSVSEDAQQALEEWWWPGPRARPTAAELEARRSAAIRYRDHVGPGYRISIPEMLTSSGVHDIPSEWRRVQTWGGCFCDDVPAVVAVNVIARSAGSFEDTVARYATLFESASAPRNLVVSGARRAARLDGLTRLNSPADPHQMIAVIVESADVVTLTIRAGIRDDARIVMERVAESFSIEERSVST